MLASDPKNILSRSTEVEITKVEKKDRRGRKVIELQPKYKQLKQTKLDKAIPGQWFLGAGDRFYAGGEGQIAAYEFDKDKPVWTAKLDGEVKTMLAGDGRLFALTEDGELYCFGKEAPQGGKVKKIHLEKKKLQEKAGDGWENEVAKILKNKGAGEGYALVLGIESGRMIEELLKQSKLTVIAFDRDTTKVQSFRRRMEAAGLYGSRVSVIEGEPLQTGLPTYLCNLIVSEDPMRNGLLVNNGEATENLFNALRPYGGVLCLTMSKADHTALAKRVGNGEKFPNAEIKRSGEMTFLTRVGALPGQRRLDSSVRQCGANPGIWRETSETSFWNFMVWWSFSRGHSAASRARAVTAGGRWAFVHCGTGSIAGGGCLYRASDVGTENAGFWRVFQSHGSLCRRG